MTKKNIEKKPAGSTQIKELPKKEKELTKEEQKKIKGGIFMTYAPGLAGGANK